MKASRAGRMPANVSAERYVLGAILGPFDDGAAVLDRVTALGLEPRHFYDHAHATLFAILVDRVAREEPIDMVALPQFLLRSGAFADVSYVAQLPDFCTSTTNVELYAGEIVQDARRREVIERLTAARAAAFEGLDAPDSITERLADELLTTSAAGNALGAWRRFDEEIDDTLARAEHMAENPDEITGISTGFRDIDDLLGRMHPNDLIVIAGRPGMGKTALTLNIAENVSAVGHTVAVFSLEMKTGQLAGRTLAGAARVQARKLRVGGFTPDDVHRLRSAALWKKRKVERMWVDHTSGIDVPDMRARIRRLIRHVGPLGLVVVDYLQLIQGDPKITSREQQVSTMTRQLKMIAGDFEVPVILLSQLNRAVEQRPDKRPTLSDLRESGAIEQDADAVLFVFRPGYYQPMNADRVVRTAAEVIVAKGRHGGTGIIDLNFFEEQTRFVDFTLSQRENPGTPPPMNL